MISSKLAGIFFSLQNQHTGFNNDILMIKERVNIKIMNKESKNRYNNKMKQENKKEILLNEWI